MFVDERCVRLERQQQLKVPVRWLADRLPRLLQQERFQLAAPPPMEAVGHREHVAVWVRRLLHVVQYRVAPRRTIPHQRARWLPPGLEEHVVEQFVAYDLEVRRAARPPEQLPEPHQLAVDEAKPFPAPVLPGG